LHPNFQDGLTILGNIIFFLTVLILITTNVSSIMMFTDVIIIISDVIMFDVMNIKDYDGIIITLLSSSLPLMTIIVFLLFNILSLQCKQSSLVKISSPY
jgi:hypothetical protein